MDNDPIPADPSQHSAAPLRRPEASAGAPVAGESSTVSTPQVLTDSPPVISAGDSGSLPALPAESVPPAIGQVQLLRELVEMVAIAIMLAVLFRTFEAEAFTIPTGSMAPSLLGRHKDLVCPQCDYHYRVGSSDEVQDNPRSSGLPIVQAICPMCRHRQTLSPDDKNQASLAGDFILVSKMAYQTAAPRRWDVIVFKFPHNPKQYFIKRLIGLPNESIALRNGDVYVGPYPMAEEPQAKDFKIARKPVDKVLAMMQVVYDNDYTRKHLLDVGIPVRWYAWQEEQEKAAGMWMPEEDYRAYRTDGTSTGEVWLRYEHRIPDDDAWDEIESFKHVTMPLPPRVITDYCEYDFAFNKHQTSSHRPYDEAWVGDLILQATVEIDENPRDGSELLLELAEGGVYFTCRINPQTGQAQLTHSQDPKYLRTADTEVRGRGSYRVRFANVDDQLLLWVNDRLVNFGDSTYGPLDNHVEHRDPREDGLKRTGDLAPVRIGSKHLAMRASKLVVLRDVYYRPVQSSYSRIYSSRMSDEEANAKEWIETTKYPLADDQFFMLGDNSGMSQDSRLWDGEPWVPRSFLIGKAVFIYWPRDNSWFKPNLERVRFIR